MAFKRRSTETVMASGEKRGVFLAELEFLSRWKDYIVNLGECPRYWVFPEIAGLLNGQREAALFRGITGPTEKKLRSLCSRHGLHYRSFISTRGFRGSSAVITGRESVFKRFLSGYEGGDSSITGRLLGYPDCCINFHARAAARRGDVNNQETLDASSPPFNHLLNNLVIARLISHFPCSYSCAASGRVARAILKAIRKMRGATAAAGVLRLLKAGVARYRGSFFYFERPGKPFKPNAHVAELLGLRKAEEISAGHDLIGIHCAGKLSRSLRRGVRTILFE